MQTKIRQAVAAHLKDSRAGIQKYLGAETDNALNELAALLAPDLQTAADEAAAKAIQERLAEVDISPAALVKRIMEERANRPDPLPRKRRRKRKEAVVTDGNNSDKEADSVNLTEGGYEQK